MITLNLSNTEAKILDAVQELGYGELLDLHLPENEKKHIETRVHTTVARFVKLLRKERRLDIVKVHGSLPVFAENSTYINGIKAREKYKLT